MNRLLAVVLAVLVGAAIAKGQSSDAASAWNALSKPAMDPAKFALTENVVIVRDHVHLTVLNGRMAEGVTTYTASGSRNGKTSVENTCRAFLRR